MQKKGANLKTQHILMLAPFLTLHSNRITTEPCDRSHHQFCIYEPNQPRELAPFLAP